jgi:nucleotide-binding universal stress UspA family protein
MTDQTSELDRRIVVGVDGSPCSKSALRWAMVQAKLTGATVDAVVAWQDPIAYGYGMGFGWATPMTYAKDDMLALAQKSLDEAIAEVAGRLDQPVEVLSRVVQGHPVEVLMEAAVGAHSLVVGTRGHGGFAGILLGSVSQHCVQHAPCPVTVIPQ